MSAKPVETSAVPPISTPVSQSKIVVAAVIGNLLEFFDFTVYSFFALTIAKLFFPAHDPVVSTLLALSAFAIGFVARPVGGFVLGHYADKHGRRAALTLTIFLMAVGSAMIGLAPGYATIGLAAPALIVFARLLQGFAQGGEFGAATATLLETGSAKGRGFRASWQLASQGAAALLGSGMAALLNYQLTSTQLLDWGWRVPFLVGVLIMPVGVYLRRHIVEEPPSAARTKGASIELGLVRKWFLTVFAIMGMTVATYVLMYYVPTYSIQYLGLPPKLSMLVSIGAAAGLSVLWVGRVMASGLFAGLGGAIFARALGERAGVLLPLLVCAAIIEVASRVEHVEKSVMDRVHTREVGAQVIGQTSGNVCRRLGISKIAGAQRCVRRKCLFRVARDDVYGAACGVAAI